MRGYPAKTVVLGATAAGSEAEAKRLVREMNEANLQAGERSRGEHANYMRQLEVETRQARAWGPHPASSSSPTTPTPRTPLRGQDLHSRAEITAVYQKLNGHT
jgi:hypothetical protein